MNRSKHEFDDLVDRAASSVRHEVPDDATVRESTTRVWNALSSAPSKTTEPVRQADRIQGCPDFQSLIPAFLEGSLTGARALLVEDHTRECLSCRKVLRVARSGESPNPKLSKLSTSRSDWRHTPVARRAIAAALVLGFGALPVALYSHYSGSAEASEVTLESARGSVYLIDDSTTRELSAGETVRGGRVRTGRDASAVVALADGSRVELNERSEFAVAGSGSDVTFRLVRGDVIVRSADTAEHRLFVSAPDCLVSGKGATFSLAAGTKGSRVTAFDGSLTVDNNGQARAIRAGEQIATSASVLANPAKREISWSADSAKYASLLPSIAALQNEIDSRVAMPGVRFSTTLLDRVPEDTVLFASIPNLAPALRDAEQILNERLAQNPALREWWQSRQSRKDGIDGVLEGIREFGPFLGSEIVIAVPGDIAKDSDHFLVLGNVADAAGLRDRVIAQAGAAKKPGAIHLVEDLATVADEQTNDRLYVYVAGDYFVAAPSVADLRRVASGSATSSKGTFAAAPFGSRIAELYHDGVGFLVAADLEKIVPTIIGDAAKANHEGEAQALQRLGVANLRTFIAEQKSFDGKGVTRASLVFNQASQGIPAWLAAPGPMGALDFISPDASVVAAFVVENPVAMADDLLASIDAVDPSFGRMLQEFQQLHGIDLRQDFVAPLGGELAFAVDGPVLPTPSWKLVFEVNDPARLQTAIERAVTELSAFAASTGNPSIAFTHEEGGGRTYHSLSMGGGLAQMTYTFASGYLIAAPSRALVENAIRYHDSGYTLPQSARFRSALPEDSNVNFSALFYQDLAPLVGPLVDRYKNSGSLSDEQRQALAAFSSSSKPTLAALYARDGQIVIACDSDQGPFGISPSKLLGMPGSFEMRDVLEEGMQRK
jgi:hypothetical protein